MSKINKTLVVPYTATQMYDLVNAVEQYPEFLPWCKATEVHSRSDNELQATIVLAKGPVNYSITTKNNMVINSQIEMRYLDGPFKKCEGFWEFIEEGNNCRINFNMEYQFINKFKALLIEPVFHPISNTLIDAFYKRAEQIYDNRS